MTLPSSLTELIPLEASTLLDQRRTDLILLILLIGLVAPFVAYGVPTVIGAEESYVVLSGSMEPALGAGDVIFVYSVDPTTIESGDVITYQTVGSQLPTTHRVTEVVRSRDFPSGVAFRAKGDANDDVDPGLIRGSDVVGVVPAISLPGVGEVILRVPYMGYVIEFVNTTVGFLLLVVLPIILFIANEGWRIAAGSDGGGLSLRADGRGDENPLAYAATAESSEDPVTSTSVKPESGDGLSLPLSTGVLAAITGYTALVTVTDVTVLSVAAFVASLGGLGLAIALRYLPVPSAGDTDSDDADDDGDRGGSESTADSTTGPGYVVIGSDPERSLAVHDLDLTIATGALGLTTLYAISVAFTATSGLTVAAAVASFGGFAFAGGLRHLASQPATHVDSEPAPTESETEGTGSASEMAASDIDRPLNDRTDIDDAGRIVRASVPPELRAKPTISLESRAELLECARLVDRLVIEDEQTGEYYLTDGGLVYTAPPDSTDRVSSTDSHHEGVLGSPGTQDGDQPPSPSTGTDPTDLKENS